MTDKELYRRINRYYPDICARIRKKKLKKFGIVFLIDTIIIVSAFFSRTAFIEKGYEIPLIVSVAALCIAVPFFIKPHILWLAPTKRGTIESVRYEDDLQVNGNYAFRGTTRSAIKKYAVCIFSVAKENGHTFELKLTKKYDSVYHVGDEIILFSGFAYPVNLNDKHSKHACCLCGNIVPGSEKVCVGCGADIVELNKK